MFVEEEFAVYEARVIALIEKARVARKAMKSAVADRLLEQCVDVYREYALKQAEAPFRVAYLCGMAVSFAVQMGMHTKADKVLKEAEALIDGCDTDIVEQVAKLRAIIDEARKANYHPSQKKKGRLQ